MDESKKANKEEDEMVEQKCSAVFFLLEKEWKTKEQYYVYTRGKVDIYQRCVAHQVLGGVKIGVRV
ncbi:MAG: hypothetical protein J6A92_06450 [Lachnospiraceae bacterium]|nr:hypothetical protein [Lachnospiraceae bacterium]